MQVNIEKMLDVASYDSTIIHILDAAVASNEITVSEYNDYCEKYGVMPSTKY